MLNVSKKKHDMAGKKQRIGGRCRGNAATTKVPDDAVHDDEYDG